MKKYESIFGIVHVFLVDPDFIFPLLNLGLTIAALFLESSNKIFFKKDLQIRIKSGR
jgi:hypothetical protein